jgi:hypothetical protein
MLGSNRARGAIPDDFFKRLPIGLLAPEPGASADAHLALGDLEILWKDIRANPAVDAGLVFQADHRILRDITYQKIGLATKGPVGLYYQPLCPG